MVPVPKSSRYGRTHDGTLRADDARRAFRRGAIRRRAFRRGAAALLIALAAALPKQAAADGAFPDSMQIFVPADAPHRIILTTNFGLIISDDDGATWEWSCEPRADDNTILYQKAASPSQRIFAVLIAHPMVYTDDLACSWTPSGGSLATLVARDAFPDPTSADRVLAAAVPPTATLQPSSVYRSTDGGLTFGPALISGPTGGDILGIESAVSDPATVYVAMYGSANNLIDPILARSSDSGATWSSTDLGGMLGPATARIIAVDPTNPRHLFLRVALQSGGEKLGVSVDGGLTFTEPVSVDKQLTAFARLASGTTLVAGLDTDGNPVGFRSTDGGATFVPWVKPPHLRALAERDGKLYAAADNFLDMFAAGVSTDEGVTWKPILTYDQVKRIKACVQDVCQDVCDNLAGLTLWPQSVCGDADPDAGSTPGTMPKTGCGCRTAGENPGVDAELASVVATLVAAGALARRRRRQT
jgi:MYXO-CTERM domain-containing protein